MNKHTPGPWNVSDDECIIVDARGQFIAQAIEPSSSVGTRTDYANAALIAAAPELLAALKGLIGATGHTRGCPNDADGTDIDRLCSSSCRGARAAIAKAKP